MKHLQLFENFKLRNDWQIGDIVVGSELKYCDNTNYIITGDKYEIVDTAGYNHSAHKNTTIRIKCLKNNILVIGWKHVLWQKKNGI